MNLNPFYSGSNPADAAMPYLQQIPGTITPYYQPYIDAGGDALSTLMGQYNSLINNPGDVYNKIGAGYQQSPGYNWSYNQAMQGANQAASAGGMAGTPSSQQTAANLATNLANQDYNAYMNQALGLYGTGLQGEQGINQMGYHASDSLASALGSNLQSEATLAFKGQEEQNKANSAMMGLVSSALGGLFGAGGGTSSLLGSLFGGGGNSTWLNPDTLTYYHY